MEPMSGLPVKTAPWDGLDLLELLTLEPLEPNVFMSRCGDPNLNDRACGGQLLGQTLMAAALTAPQDRAPSTLQVQFTQGAFPEEPIVFQVTVLQEGRRLSSRHVRGMQREKRIVIDAQASFASPILSPRHSNSISAEALGPSPDSLPEMSEFPHQVIDWLRPLGLIPLDSKQCLELRIPEYETQLAPHLAQPRLRYWIRAKRALSHDTRTQCAVLAYLSDYRMNFSSLLPLVKQLETNARLYTASLNHRIYFHRAFKADDWIHFDSVSPCAHGGRGLSIAYVRCPAGDLIATIIQESLVTVRPEQGVAAH